MANTTEQHPEWLSSLHELPRLYNELSHWIFPNEQVAEMDISSLVTELVYFEIYKKYSEDDNRPNHKYLNETLKKVTDEVLKLPSGGAFLMYPESIPESSQGAVKLTIKKGESLDEHYANINGVIEKHIGFTISFDNLVADLQCNKNIANIAPQDSMFKRLRYGAKFLAWNWIVSPKKGQEIIVLNVNVYLAGERVSSSVRDSAWPSYTPPRVVVNVVRGLGDIISDFFKNPYVIAIASACIGGLVVALFTT